MYLQTQYSFFKGKKGRLYTNGNQNKICLTTFSIGTPILHFCVICSVSFKMKNEDRPKEKLELSLHALTSRTLCKRWINILAMFWTQE